MAQDFKACATVPLAIFGACCNRLQDFVEAIGSALTTTVRNVRNRSQKLLKKIATKGKPHGFS